MSEFIINKSVADVHRIMQIDPPKHPLVSVLWHCDSGVDEDYGDVKITGDLYFLALKDGVTGSMPYGRGSYDFEDGTMIFTAPGQVLQPPRDVKDTHKGWSLVFHPDLIRGFELGRNMERYSFFDYESNEALHLSDREKTAMNELIRKIEHEIELNMDRHSQKLIVTNIELLLDYCLRFYDRQFYTRSNQNEDVVTRFEKLLKSYFQHEKQLEIGLPSVQYCAEQLNISPNYLSDLLRKETGRNAHDHIHAFIVDRAKTLLLNSNDTISRVAFGLGFDYSQHFSKLFKDKTGMTPKEFRTQLN